jgi:hypothetical protein
MKTYKNINTSCRKGRRIQTIILALFAGSIFITSCDRDKDNVFPVANVNNTDTSKTTTTTTLGGNTIPITSTITDTTTGIVNINSGRPQEIPIVKTDSTSVTIKVISPSMEVIGAPPPIFFER